MSSITVKLTSVDGRTNVEAARASFETALSEHLAQTETEMNSVKGAVLSVFAEYPGKNIKLGVIGDYAARRLNSTPDNHATLSGLAQDFVRANSKGDDSLIVIVRGQGGGAVLRSEMSVEA